MKDYYKITYELNRGTLADGSPDKSILLSIKDEMENSFI